MKGLVSRWARLATSPEKRGLRAGEARWRRLRNRGEGENERAQERGRKRAPTARMRAPSFSLSQVWVSDCTPNADGADVTGGGATRSHPAGTRSRCASLEVAGGHLFLSWGFRKQVTRTHFSLLALFVPLPHEDGGGKSWACQGESAPGFPAHFNSVRASTARRFTPPGAPEPSAGTRSASPRSSSPTHFSPGMESGSLDLFF